ncbi:MAG: hypothetical protein IPM54_22830 [Polyangiaceae bacterium]|nr:hypothetical protein [Polyangiaceae bacterium]
MNTAIQQRETRGCLPRPKILPRRPSPRPSNTPESERWHAYIDSLDARIERREISGRQREALCSIWQRARQRFPALRHPSVGRTDDAWLHLSWTYADLPGLSFTIDIDPDGHLEWFYRNVKDGKTLGTEDDLETGLSEEAMQYLLPFEQQR